MTINDTKIKYLLVAGKIYEVTSINWLHLFLEARETDLTVGDIEEEELWDISYFDDFKIRLVNRCGAGQVIDLAEWREGHGKQKP